MIRVLPARCCRDGNMAQRLIVGCLILLSSALCPATGWSQGTTEIVRLKDGRTVEGFVLLANLNIMVLRRAIGGVELVPNQEVAEVALDHDTADAVTFQFDNWINGAASFERQGEVVAITDWREAEATPTPVAAAATADGSPLVLSTSVESGQEGGEAARVRLVLSKPASTPIPLVYATSDGTAIAGADYETVTGVVTFEAGMQENELEIPILEDGEVEGVEFLKLIVNADPALVSLDPTAQILAVIRDND